VRSVTRAFAWLPILVAMACLACTAYRDGAYKVIAGEYFDTRLVSQIEDGVTTQEQVIEWFGDPLETNSDSAAEVWRYYVIRERENVENPLLGGKTIHVQTVDQELVIQLSGGVVTSHEFRGESQESVR